MLHVASNVDEWPVVYWSGIWAAVEQNCPWWW